MKSFIIIVCALFFSRVALGAGLGDGVWGGWIEVDSERSWFQLHVRDGQPHIMDFNTGWKRQAAHGLELWDECVRFVYEAPVGDVHFEGRVSGRVMEGRMSLGGGMLGSFQLTRFFNLGVEDLSGHIGCYRRDDGRDVWVVPRTGGGIRTVEYTGYGKKFGDYSFEAWLPWKEDAYFGAEYDRPALPPERTIAFEGEIMRVSGEGG